MPLDLAVKPQDAPAPLSAPPVRFVAPAEPVIIRRRSARQALLDAELRGAPDQELRILEEAAIAASIARVRQSLRAGLPVTPARRTQLERDQELLRRFPDDRRGTDGEGWFHVPR